MLHTNLHRVICPQYLNKTGKKKDRWTNQQVKQDMTLKEHLTLSIHQHLLPMLMFHFS